MHKKALAIVKSARVGGQCPIVSRVEVGVEKVLFVCDFSNPLPAPCVNIRVVAVSSIGKRQKCDWVVVNTVSGVEVGRVIRRNPTFPAFLVCAKDRLWPGGNVANR